MYPRLRYSDDFAVHHAVMVVVVRKHTKARKHVNRSTRASEVDK